MPVQPKAASARTDRRRASRELIFWAVLIIGFVSLVVGLSLLPAADAASGPARVGKRLADFSLQTLDGRTVQLSDYRGRTVLINAWATWCPPCRREMPDLHALYLRYQSSGVELLALNAGESPDLVQEYIQQSGFTFPVLLDPGTEVLNQLGIHDYPTTLLVDSQGVVQVLHIGLLTPAAMDTELVPFLP